MGWNTNALGIVINSTHNADFKTLKSQGLSFVVIEAGTGFSPNPALADQISKAKSANLAVLVQYSPYPAMDDYTYDGIWQEEVVFLKKLLGFKVIDGLIVSIDRYWTGTDVEDGRSVRTASSNAISNVATNIVSTMKKYYDTAYLNKQMTKIPQILVRTNDNFVKNYSPDVANWSDHWGFDLADWRYRTRNAIGEWVISYSYLSVPTPVADLAALRAACPPDNAKNPLVPGMTPQLKLWEFSGDRFILPTVKGWDGSTKRIGVVLFNGGEDACYSYFSFIPAPVNPQPEPEPQPDPTNDNGNGSGTGIPQTDFDALKARVENLENILKELKALLP